MLSYPLQNKEPFSMWKLCFILLFFTNIYADIVYLKNGRSLEGDVFDKPNSVVLKMPTGQVEIKKSDIASIENSKSKIEIFAEKKQQLDSENAEGWFQLFQWAKTNRFGKEDLLLLLDKTIQADPAHEKAQEIVLDMLTEDERQEQERAEQEERERLEEEKKRAEELRKKAQQEKIRKEKRKEREEKERIQFGLLPFEIRYNVKKLTDFEDFIDSIYYKQHFFPVKRFANRGGLNLLFSFISSKALRAGFTSYQARELANKYKNIAAVGGDQAEDVMRRVFFTILRLDRQRNPNRPRSANNRFQDTTNKYLFLLALRFGTKVASGGSNADTDFDSTYRFLFFKFNKRQFLGLPETLSYRLAIKCAAIVAAGGGDRRFRKAFGFHLRQFRRERGSLRRAVFPAIEEAIKEVQHPRRFFQGQRRN